jgi:drug/metabolite transporter (DMT)-like permease
LRVAALTLLALTAFAANSLLCRAALQTTSMDAATFTTIRLVTGAMALAAVAGWRGGRAGTQGGWISAAALFAYAIAFSFAYTLLSAATGALLLFGAVQVTMIFAGWRSGERLNATQSAGVVLAVAGLISLLLPGLAAPPLVGSLLMIASGMAWGVYSLRGRSVTEPVAATAANFARATPLALATSVLAWPWAQFDAMGALLAAASGVIASGVGYIIWYTALPRLTATRAAIVQLSVPVIAAFGGVVLLDERISWRLILASVATLGGIALVVAGRRARLC